LLYTLHTPVLHTVKITLLITRLTLNCYTWWLTNLIFDFVSHTTFSFGS